MPHNLKVNYGRASISINSTHGQVGLRVQTSTADHQGRRTEDFSLEIGGPRPNAHALPAPGYLHPGEYLPMASLAREPRDGRMRGIPQPPPPLDGYDAVQHDAADYGSYGRSRQSIGFEDAYYWPAAAHERAPTRSRSVTGTGTGYEYATAAHEPTHGMGGERVQYHSARDPESGRIERPSAAEPLRPPRHPNPSISITPPTTARNSAAYRGSELVLRSYGAPDGSPASTPCGSYSYYDEDGGGGVSAQRQYAWSEASDLYSDAQDGSEWSGGGERVGFGGEDRRYH